MKTFDPNGVVMMIINLVIEREKYKVFEKCK